MKGKYENKLIVTINVKGFVSHVYSQTLTFTLCRKALEYLDISFSIIAQILSFKVFNEAIAVIFSKIFN